MKVRPADGVPDRYDGEEDGDVYCSVIGRFGQTLMAAFQ